LSRQHIAQYREHFGVMYTVIRLVTIVVSTALFFQSIQDGSSVGRNLFEFSVVSYGEGGGGFPFPNPPEIKIYESGRIVLREDGRYLEGSLSAKELVQLKKKLSANRLLASSHVDESATGKMLAGLHGGFAFVRYLDDDLQVLVVSRYVPDRGPMASLIRDVRAARPKQFQPLRPNGLTLVAFDSLTNACPSNRIWPFGERVRLGSLVGHPTEVHDPDIRRYLFPDGITSLLFDVCDDGKTYSLYVARVTEWYDGDQLGAAIDAQKLLAASRSSSNP
jgi:hypothetical protein